MRYGFTGVSRKLNDDELGLIALAINKVVRAPEVFITGGAPGVDTHGMILSLALFPDTPQKIIVPDAPWNKALMVFVENFRGVTLKQAPSGSDRSDSYMKRNSELVRALSQGDPKNAKLIAFPPSAVEQLRSGTWATIRRARKAGVGVAMFPLDEVTNLSRELI